MLDAPRAHGEQVAAILRAVRIRVDRDDAGRRRDREVHEAVLRGRAGSRSLILNLGAEALADLRELARRDHAEVGVCTTLVHDLGEGHDRILGRGRGIVEARASEARRMNAAIDRPEAIARGRSHQREPRGEALDLLTHRAEVIANLEHEVRVTECRIASTDVGLVRGDDTAVFVNLGDRRASRDHTERLRRATVVVREVELHADREELRVRTSQQGDRIADDARGAVEAGQRAATVAVDGMGHRVAELPEQTVNFELARIDERAAVIRCLANGELVDPRARVVTGQRDQELLGLRGTDRSACTEQGCDVRAAARRVVVDHRDDHVVAVRIAVLLDLRQKNVLAHHDLCGQTIGIELFKKSIPLNVAEDSSHGASPFLVVAATARDAAAVPRPLSRARLKSYLVRKATSDARRMRSSSVVAGARGAPAPSPLVLNVVPAACTAAAPCGATAFLGAPERLESRRA